MPKPLQVLLKWKEDIKGIDYWYVIRRTSTGIGYAIEGYYTEETGKSISPQFSFPVDQDYVAEEFKKQGKEWVREMYGQ